MTPLPPEKGEEGGIQICGLAVAVLLQSGAKQERDQHRSEAMGQGIRGN
jgi:hypothetical protein